MHYLNTPNNAQMDQFNQINQINDFDSLSSPTPSLEPAPEPTPEPTMLALPPLATYPSKEALFEAIQAWAKPRGYAFSIARSTQKKADLRCSMHVIVGPKYS